MSAQNAKRNGLIQLIKTSLLGSVILLSGCAGTKIFSPSTWFSSPLVVSSSGIGEVTAFTPMQMDTVVKQLDNRYRIRTGMQMEKGEMITIFQGLDDDQVKIELFGPEHGYVSRIVVSDPNVRTAWGPAIDTPFSDIYQKAFGACGLGERINDKPTIECNAPESSKVVYRFSGTWHGPEDIMPSDNDLKDWTIMQIIWNR